MSKVNLECFNNLDACKNIFPYPSTFNKEQVEELNEMYEQSRDAFKAENRALEQDLKGELEPEMVDKKNLSHFNRINGL